MLSPSARFRLAVGFAAALAASLIAGCCGSFGANGDDSCVSCGASTRAGATCSPFDASFMPVPDAPFADVNVADAGPDVGGD